MTHSHSTPSLWLTTIIFFSHNDNVIAAAVFHFLFFFSHSYPDSPRLRLPQRCGSGFALYTSFFSVLLKANGSCHTRVIAKSDEKKFLYKYLEQGFRISD